jgi:protein-S-isoprenylcysteine O-methyltransferase Ste14
MRPIIPPPILALAIAFAMYWLAGSLDIAPFAVSGGRALATIVFAAGFLIDAISVAAFVRAKTTVNPMAPSRAQALVTGGLYRFSRNPMYLGMLLMLSAAFLYFGEGANAALLALFVVLINELQIKPEEKALEAKFGDEYRAYKKRVRRWL